MWSPYHYLYKIRKDQSYAGSIKTTELKAILAAFDEITPTGELFFRNKEQYPNISMLIVNSNNGNFAIQDHNTTYEEINLIEIQTSKKEDQKEWYLNFMLKIAKALNWELILSEDDEENEEILIWKNKKL